LYVLLFIVLAVCLGAAVGDTDVIVLYNDRTVMQTTNPAVARRLIADGHAVVYSRMPFTIILTDEVTKQVKSGKFSLTRVISWK
jgi:hypothetical protein